MGLLGTFSSQLSEFQQIMTKALVYGTLIAEELNLQTAQFSEFEVVTAVQLEKSRAENRRIELELKDDDIIELTFSDQTQWIGNALDIEEIYNAPASGKRSGEVFVFEPQVTGRQASRGAIGSVVVKTLKLIRAKTLGTAAETSAKNLAIAYDKRAMPQPGLYKLDAGFQYMPVAKIAPASTAYLLLIHGTLSNTFAAFAELRLGQSPIWDQLMRQYNAGILALDHRTLSVSPLQNALDFLEHVDQSVSVEILSHSRGGLVADVLAKCDHRNEVVGFSDLELGMMTKEDPEAFELMKKINTIARKKKIEVRKVIRVAAPASGTTLLSRRTDHFLNVLLNALGLVVGAQVNVVYNTVKLFLLEVVKQKANHEAMPGLYSMVPDSSFQKMLNFSGSAVANDLYVIASDAEVGGHLGDSLKVILANLFYWKANDLVVDSDRMEQGAPRLGGIQYFLSKDGSTNHFNYFRNQNTCDAILQAAVTAPGGQAGFYSQKFSGAGNRGVLLSMFSMEGVHYEHVSGNKRIAILLPGIMGSSLDHNGNPQWIDFRELNRGAIKDDLEINTSGVEASGVIKKYYDDFVKHLLKTHDVITFPFDWRKSVKGSAAQLAKKVEHLLDTYNQPIHIIAHSMGGLVVRQFMMDAAPVWKRFIEKPANKFVMLGTPWLGSYLIMEVLTGHSSRVKQLAMIDFKNSKEELLQVFREFPGIFELLPIENNSKRPFWDSQFWKDRKAESTEPMVIPLKKDLDQFKKYRDSVLDFVTHLTEDDLKEVYYVAGHAEQTVYDYKTESRFLSNKKKLVYLATTAGDSSVTWVTGIPSRIPKDNVYYTHTSHGELANDPRIYDGIVDILLEGKTNRLLKTKPISRAGEVISEVHAVPAPGNNLNLVGDVLFGIEPARKSTQPDRTMLNVAVINADLKVSRYPVMLGHFNNDGVHSAEKALDNYLNGRLMQRYDMGYYPGKIGESEVFFNLNTNPRGAIVCGLGNSQELTHYLLAKTVEMAALKYAMFMRDNYTLAKAKSYAEGISFILMGTGYGRLQIEDSIKGILLGVSSANRFIKEHGEGLQELTQVEFVNHYESLASQAYWALSRLKNSDNRFNFELIKGIERKEGAKKRRAFVDESEDWWHHFNVKSICDGDRITGFAYNSSSGLARIEEEEVHNGLEQVGILLEQMSRSSAWDKRLSKTLFELLIPNQFKDIIRNQNNILFKLDLKAAQFPWELFHDFESDETPAAVNSGLIRQLLTSDYESNQLRSVSNKTLIIGDPIYNEASLPQLAAAKAEAQMVNDKLKNSGFETFPLLNSNATDIMLQLYTNEYKLLHFAGHGLYDPANNRVGIAIGNGICIDPAMIKQLSYVPEFVFINCCFSGTLNATDDAFMRSRYKLAANIGTQLIAMGVKAIIVTGWAVDDAAAETFSEEFYSRMLSGYEFGEAVQMARKKCYQNHRHTNTWGAYQCYGNQHYKFFEHVRQKEEVFDYVLSSQVYTDLENLYASIRHSSFNPKTVKRKLDEILENASRNDLIDGVIREKEALIYDELDMPAEALDTFRAVLTLEDANFSMKVLEHFCLLRSLNFSKDAAERKEELDLVTKLALIGKTTLRLGIVGNCYKFASMHEKGEKQLQYLQTALDYYTEAYDNSTNPYDGKTLDAFSNIVFLSYLLEAYGKGNLKNQLNKYTKKPVFAYLSDFLKHLDDVDPADLDISVLLGMTEVSFGMLLVNSEKGGDQVILDELNKRFAEAFQILHSSRQIRIELAQLDFLLSHESVIPKEKASSLLKVKESLLRFK